MPSAIVGASFLWVNTLEALRQYLAHPAAAFIVVVVVATLVQVLMGRAVMRLARARYMAESSAARLRVLLRWALFVVAGLVALQVTGAMGHAWAVLSATVAALAVGFVASWSLLSNFTAAVILLTFRPFRIGDEIEILEGDKVLAEGEVLDLNLFFTTLSTEDKVNRVPNNLLLQRVIRVSREGTPPDPSDDASKPFFPIPD